MLEIMRKINIKKLSGGRRKRLVKYVILGVCIILMYTVCLIMDNNGEISRITDAGRKLQELSDGEWKVLYSNYDEGEKMIPAGELTAGKEITQKFMFSEEMLEYDVICFAFYTATYNRDNTGEITIIIGQNDYAAEYNMSMSDIEDNGYTRILVETEYFEPGDAFVKFFSEDGEPGNTVTVYMTDCTGYYNYITVEGKRIHYNLKMKVYVPF